MSKGNRTGKGGFGDNPQNRHRYGQISADAVAFTKHLRQALVEEGERRKGRGPSNYELMIQKVWTLATLGAEWAVKYVSERVEGKVPDKLQLDDVTYSNYLIELNKWVHQTHDSKEDQE